MKYKIFDMTSMVSVSNLNEFLEGNYIESVEKLAEKTVLVVYKEEK